VANKRLTHRERQVIINRPIVLLNHRIVHSVKRWGGVYVNDNFGENRKPALQRLAGMTGDEAVGLVEPVTQFDSSFHLADFALWERIGGGVIK
jgi:hypothetical protein